MKNNKIDNFEILGYFASWLKETHPDMMIRFGEKDKTSFTTKEVKNLLNSLNDQQKEQYQKHINENYPIQNHNNEMELLKKDIIALTHNAVKELEDIPGIDFSFGTYSSLSTSFPAAKIEQEQPKKTTGMISKIRDAFFKSDTNNNQHNMK